MLTGTIKCELGASVTIEADEKKPGFFTLTHGNDAATACTRSNSRTGAIRLEDPRAEAMWLQLGNKSMLMSQKQGLRLADECQAAEQAEVAEDMKKNPPKSLFEGARRATTRSKSKARRPAFCRRPPADSSFRRKEDVASLR